MKAGDLLAGRFELERVAGSGGMGAVYQARDRESGDLVAVKSLLDARAGNTARFEREARVLAELSHPGIVRYIAHGETDAGEPFIAMEWLDGEDLQTRMIRRGLTLGESVVLVERAAQALGAAHARGIVHRDLKPTNLFLVGGDVEKVKILDFGIAWHGGAPRMTYTGSVVGTPGYMAPEQARGEGVIDARVDVFSLGCVLFECLTGRPAFSGAHVLAVLAKVLVEEPPRVRDLRPYVPPDLDVLVTRMLAKSPEERPSDGGAVVKALAALGTPEALAAVGFAAGAALTRSERRTLSVVLIGRETQQSTAEALTLGVTAVSSASAALRREAEAHGGHLEELADGSVLVSLSGVGLATDQAAQAARCALALRLRAADRPVALATGRGELTGRLPFGEAIDRAARMLWSPTQRTQGGPQRREAIAIDEVTAGLLDAGFEVRESDSGLSLQGEREIAEGARTLLGKPTACVGRDRELSTLEQLFAGCVDEPEAQAILVTAPAGTGKSRLAHELVRRIERRGRDVSIWTGRADSLRAGSPLGLLGQVIRGACGIREGEPLEVRREKVRERVAEHVGAAERVRVTEFLGEMIGTPFPDDESVKLREARKDAQHMSEQMQGAWEEFAGAATAARPLLLVLEDLHWGDRPTLRFVFEAMRRLRDRPWMTLFLARPEVHETFPRLREERGLQEIHLKELSPRASERLVRQVLGDAVGAETVARLVAQADGNAFYLEELIRATAERRGEALPETVVAMVQSRLGALDAEARRVLRAASVFGEAFSPDGVASLLGGAPEVAGKLAELTEHEVLVQHRKSRFQGEEELAFRHALLREGAYGMLTDDDRALGHRLAGEWLSRHGESDPVVLAEHFEQGRDPARAQGYYLRAAEQALRGNDAEAAIARARRGLSCGVSGGLRVDLLGVLCEAQGWRNEWSLAARDADEATRLAAPGSAPWVRGGWIGVMDAAYRNDPEKLLAALGMLEGAPPEVEAAVPFTFGLVYGAFYLASRGRVDDAELVLRRSRARMAPFADREPVAWGLLTAFSGYLRGYSGEDPWAGLIAAREGGAAATTADHRRVAGLSRMIAGMNLWLLGARGEAEDTLAGITSTDSQLGPGSSVRSYFLARALADRGALREARDVAARLVEAGRSRSSTWGEGRGRWALADVHRLAGELDAAAQEALASLDLLAGYPVEQVAAKATLAGIRLAQGRAAEALTGAEEAMAGYASLGACGFFRGPMLRLVHAECLDALGRRDAAAAALAAARERLLALADRIGDPGYRRSFLEDVPEHARTLELSRQWLGIG